MQVGLNITLISMLNNEISLSQAFVNHTQLLFSKQILAIHNAIDGTFEELNSRLPGSVLKIDSAGYPQSTIMTSLMIKAFEEGADIVVPLDADEFLPFSTQNELSDFLKANSDTDVLQVRWRNFSPSTFPLESNLTNLVFAHDHSAIYKSFIFRSAYLKDSFISLNQGNHDIQSSAKLKRRIEPFSYIIHVPIRDPLHFAQKNIHGATAYLQEKTHTLSDDWVSRSLNPFPPESELVQLALDYGEKRCIEEHKSLRQIELKPWMRNGYSTPRQRESFLSAMRVDWPKLREIYKDAGDGETTAVEVLILRQRLEKFESSFVFRLIRKLERNKISFFKKQGTAEK